MISGQRVLHLYDQQLILDSQRALFWTQQRMLVLSDLHLGKVAHFRKNGIAVPSGVHATDLLRLEDLIRQFDPDKILFLGDLFHSELNSEWDDFTAWSHRHGQIEQLLVQGNHDIMSDEVYSATRLKILTAYQEGPFIFTHELEKGVKGYNVAGHVHPGIRLYGAARQAMVLSCFYFGQHHALLPAFGAFTGNHPVKALKGDRIFAIADGKLVDLIG